MSFKTSEADLRDAFGKFGAVTDVYIANDRETGRPRGFAFVTFATEEEAKAAAEKMNGVDLDGRQLTGAPPYKRSLPPGVHRLKVEGSGHEPIETEITLVAGDLRVLRFEIQPLPASKPKK